MKRYFFLLGLITLTIAGLLIIGVVNRYFNYGIDRVFVYYLLAMLGALLSGINFIVANNKLKRSKN